MNHQSDLSVGFRCLSGCACFLGTQNHLWLLQGAASDSGDWPKTCSKFCSFLPHREKFWGLLRDKDIDTNHWTKRLTSTVSTVNK